MKKQPSDVFAKWLEEAKRLRSSADEHTADFFQHLQGGEDVEIHKHSPAGYPTFVSTLVGENLCDPRRYESFKREVARVGFDAVRACGFEQLRPLLRVPEGTASKKDPTKTVDQAVVEYGMQSRIRNGVPLSPRQTLSVLRQHWDEPVREPKEVDETDPYKRIAELEKKLAKVTRERDAALAKVAKLEAKLHGKTRPSASGGSTSTTAPPLA